ncbi:MAG: azurin [Bacteroidota bacterium]|nr:azurin [Bacteroidota bacterium]
MKRHLLTITALAFVFASCGGGGEEQPAAQQENQNQTEEQATPVEEPAAEEAPAEIPAVAELSIEGNDQMMYNKKELQVYEGQKVKLTLKHVGQMPVETMGHNWTLLKQGVDYKDFGNAAAMAKDNNYIPKGREDEVIVHTEMIGGGQETTIEFEAPAVGDYKFLCTFPGHYAMMNGTFKVLPRPGAA